MATGKEKWEDTLTSSLVTPMHLLHPANMIIQVEKCLITDDPRLPKLKVVGSLPSVTVDVAGNYVLKHICFYMLWFMLVFNKLIGYK
jgi:vacuolar protein sorting-associated protein 13A/C